MITTLRGGVNNQPISRPSDDSRPFRGHEHRQPEGQWSLLRACSPAGAGRTIEDRTRHHSESVDGRDASKFSDFALLNIRQAGQMVRG